MSAQAARNLPPDVVAKLQQLEDLKKLGQVAATGSKPARAANGNMVIAQEGSILTITIDTAQELGPSGSGKSVLIATTSGNIALAGGLKLGLNLYRPI